MLVQVWSPCALICMRSSRKSSGTESHTELAFSRCIRGGLACVIRRRGLLLRPGVLWRISGIDRRIWLRLGRRLLWRSILRGLFDGLCDAVNRS